MWVVVGLEGMQRDLRDVGVVTDEAREGHFLERVPLLLSEDPGVLPPEPAETQAGSPRSPAAGSFPLCQRGREEVPGNMPRSGIGAAGRPPQCPPPRSASLPTLPAEVSLTCPHHGSAGIASLGGRPGEAPPGLFLPWARRCPQSRCQCCRGSCRDPVTS